MNYKRVEVVSYNPDWPKQFEEEVKGIKQALGDNYVLAYHIGSTSVPGLSAKEDIDIG